MYKEYLNKNEDCPECGKKEGAHTGSTIWGHDVSCCSDECGYKVKKKIVKNTNSKEYIKQVKKSQLYASKALEIKYKGINGIGFRDSTGFY